MKYISDFVYQDDEVVAFRDINPQAPVHILVIPRKPLAPAADAKPEDAHLMGRVMLVAAEVAREHGLKKQVIG